MLDLICGSNLSSCQIHLPTKEFRPARQKHGGQALNLLAIALKTNSDKPMHLGI